jgi:hypothetical protein
MPIDDTRWQALAKENDLPPAPGPVLDLRVQSGPRGTGTHVLPWSQYQPASVSTYQSSRPATQRALIQTLKGRSTAMDITTLKYGDLVHFGRTHGEKTLGRVLKVNRKTVKVEQLEARGQFRSYPVGTKWNLAPVFVERAPEGASAQAVTKPENLISVPSPEQAALLAEVERLKRENAALKARRSPAPKRAEATVLDEIRNVYGQLSPENVSCDGELPRSEVARRVAALNRQLRALFAELGRPVSESEAFGF